MHPDAPAVGERGPTFRAPLVRPDAGTETVSVSQLLGERRVLLCFYPRDFGPNCVDGWCPFRDYNWFRTDDKVRVVGISKSPPDRHREFIAYLGLGFPLFTDESCSIASDYGVRERAVGDAGRARRSCFLLDRDRTVRYRWIAEEPGLIEGERPDVAEIHHDIREILGEPDVETFGFA